MMIDEWISVKDRLPECPEWAIVYYEGAYKIVTMLFFDGERGGNFFWIDNNGEDWENITYWMPLPEAPKNTLEKK